MISRKHAFSNRHPFSLLTKHSSHFFPQRRRHPQDSNKGTKPADFPCLGVLSCLTCRMAPAPTPAPSSLGLLCIYKQYKADTETIATWLKANAIKHGYKFDGQDGTTIRTSDFIPSKCLRPFHSLSLSLQQICTQLSRGNGYPPQGIPSCACVTWTDDLTNKMTLIGIDC